MEGMPSFPDALLRRVQGSWVPSKVTDVARRLHQHDPNLTLVVRINRRSKLPECYDLFERDRHGQQHWVSRWGLNEVDRILNDVLVADRTTADFQPVAKRLEAAYDAKLQKAQSEGTDLMMEFADRVDGVKRELESEPKTFFGQYGK